MPSGVVCKAFCEKAPGVLSVHFMVCFQSWIRCISKAAMPKWYFYSMASSSLLDRVTLPLSTSLIQTIFFLLLTLMTEWILIFPSVDRTSVAFRNLPQRIFYFFFMMAS